MEKAIKHCSNCTTKYTVEWNEEEQDLEPLTCPFCGFEVETEETVNTKYQKKQTTIVGIDYSLNSPHDLY